MSKANHFVEREGAFDQYAKSITADYTVKVGSVADNFYEDRVLKVTTTAGTGITIKVPDGAYAGQRLLIIFDTEGDDETVTLTPDSGTLTNLTAATGYSSLEYINGTVGWVALASSAT